MYGRVICRLSIGLALGLAALPAQEPQAPNVVIEVAGKLGPKLHGLDPAKAAGKPGSIKATASSTLAPVSSTATSVTYTLPIGAVQLEMGGKHSTNNANATLTISIPATGPDEVEVKSKFTMLFAEPGSHGPLVDANVTCSFELQNGSFSSAVLQNPVAFSPSPQSVTAATSPRGPGAKLIYSARLIGKTILGVKGRASAK